MLNTQFVNLQVYRGQATLPGMWQGSTCTVRVDSWDAFLNLTSRSFCHIYHKWLETSAKISLDSGDGIGLSPIPFAGFAPQQLFLPNFVQSSPQYLIKKAFPGFSPGLAYTPHISRLHYKIQQQQISLPLQESLKEANVHLTVDCPSKSIHKELEDDYACLRKAIVHGSHLQIVRVMRH